MRSASPTSTFGNDWSVPIGRSNDGPWRSSFRGHKSHWTDLWKGDLSVISRMLHLSVRFDGSGAPCLYHIATERHFVLIWPRCWNCVGICSNDQTDWRVHLLSSYLSHPCLTRHPQRGRQSTSPWLSRGRYVFLKTRALTSASILINFWRRDVERWSEIYRCRSRVEIVKTVLIIWTNLNWSPSVHLAIRKPDKKLGKIKQSR